MADPHREVERKYEADEAFEMPSLVELLTGREQGSSIPDGPLSEGEMAQHRLDATYFDTADLRLAAAGLTLRRRTGGDDAGWHLKVPAGTATRTEVRLPPGRVPPGRTPRTVPAELQAMVWAQTFGAPLQPVARLTTERSLRRLTDATGRALAEVADDRVTGRRLLDLDGAGEAAGAATHWREVEVMVRDGAGDLGDMLDVRLRGQGLRRPRTASTVPRVLGPVDDGDSLNGSVPRLTVKSPAGEVLMAHVRQQVAQVRAQDLPVRLDAPDSVHKMRVATRRLRSALSTFKPLVEPDVAGPLRAELKWLAGVLGAARDAEVMRDRVHAAVEEQGTESAVRAGADAARSELNAVYRAAHDRVLAELDGDRYHRILTMLRALVDQPPLRKRARGSAGKVLPALVARSFDTVRRIVEEAAARSAGAERDELLHDARKAAKQSRYAGESVAGVFGKDATSFAAAMEEVQEALGEHQDSVLTRERLHSLAVHASTTEVAFLYGRLHALEEARAEQSHEHFDTAWKAARRKSLHRWLR